MGLFKILKRLIPKSIKKYYHKQLDAFTFKGLKKKHLIALKKVKEKETITVAFFVIFGALWKYDLIYKLLENDNRFNPIIIICPYINYGDENMHLEMSRAYSLFKSKGYNVISTYLESSKNFIDVKNEIKPDIVFFTNPHSITHKEYYINNFVDTLTCYVQYSFHVSSLNNEQYDQRFHNLLWKAFYETPIHKAFAIKYSRNKAVNVEVTGYPGTDIFLDENYQPCDVWKIKSPNIKRVIWAPHHTINENDSNLGYSNFLQYANYFLELLGTYKDALQIAFKPHPILKQKLYLHPDWGKFKTDDYYLKWEVANNAMLFEDDYVDLFCTSDAIIHDSGSFLVEYLYQNKPSLFCFRNTEITNKFNDFGKLALNVNAAAYTKDDINNFLTTEIFNGNDLLFKSRTEFISTYLIPPNNNTASQNIYNIILKELKA